MKSNPPGVQPHRLDSESSSLKGEPKNRFPLAGALSSIFGGDSLWSPILRKCAVGLVAIAGVALLGMQAPLPPRAPLPPSTSDAAELAALDAPSPPPLSERTSVRTSGGLPISGAPPPSAPSTDRPDGPVDPCKRGQANATPPNTPLGLNSATAEDFERLPGVGPKKAQEIVKLRARLGKFKRVSDLLRVRGVGFKTLQKWKPLVVVDEPPAVGPTQTSSEVASPDVAPPSRGTQPSQAEPGSAQER